MTFEESGCAVTAYDLSVCYATKWSPYIQDTGTSACRFEDTYLLSKTQLLLRPSATMSFPRCFEKLNVERRTYIHV